MDGQNCTEKRCCCTHRLRAEWRANGSRGGVCQTTRLRGEGGGMQTYLQEVGYFLCNPCVVPRQSFAVVDAALVGHHQILGPPTAKFARPPACRQRRCLAGFANTLAANPVEGNAILQTRPIEARFSTFFNRTGNGTVVDTVVVLHNLRACDASTWVRGIKPVWHVGRGWADRQRDGHRSDEEGHS